MFEGDATKCLELNIKLINNREEKKCQLLNKRNKII